MKELYQDTDKAVAYIGDMYQQDLLNKQELVRMWERCAAFANGNQNFLGSLSGNSQLTASNMIFSQFQDTRSQMFIQNEIEPIMRTLVSYLTRAKPSVEVFPSDHSEERKMKARVAERVHEAKYDLDNESQNSRKAAWYGLCFGSAIRKDFWDMSAGRDAEMPVYDELGNEVIDPETGKVQTNIQKTGDTNVAILTPLSLSFDWSYSEWDELPWIMESYLMPVDWIKQMYDKDEPGYTGKAADIVEGGSIGAALSVLEHLKYASPFTYGLGTKIVTRGKALMQEVYIAPSSEMPRGRMIIKCQDVALYDSALIPDGESPYYYPARQVMWHPYTPFFYSPYIGRLWAKSLVETLIPQQMRLNEISGAIIYNANTLAKVDILAAENQLKRGVINGMGGNVYTYRPVPDAPPPIKWQGVPLPTQFFKEKEDIIAQMVREAGTNFVMQGQPPTGVTAAAAIEQLLENANTQQSDTMIAWERFHEQGFTKKLRLIRKFNNLPNEDIVDYLRTMNKDNLDIEIKSFVGEDIGDGWMLRIESGSTIPKSEKNKRQIYVEFAKEGLLGPLTEDSPRGARLRKELLQKFGEKGFEIEENSDVEKAIWENEKMMIGEPVEVWEKDNHQIHINVLVAKMKDPKWLERATDEVKEAFNQHLMMHEQMQQQMMPQPPIAGIPGEMPPPPGQEMSGENIKGLAGEKALGNMAELTGAEKAPEMPQ